MTELALFETTFWILTVVAFALGMVLAAVLAVAGMALYRYWSGRQ